jgi:hypothetical protein
MVEISQCILINAPIMVKVITKNSCVYICMRCDFQPIKLFLRDHILL